MNTGSHELRSAFLLHVTHQVIGADGVVDPRERALVERLLPSADLQAAGLIDAHGERTERFDELAGEALVRLPLMLRRPEKLEVLDELFTAAMADGEFHKEEGWVLAHTSRLLGLPAAQYDQWLASKRLDDDQDELLVVALKIHLLDRLAASDGAVDAREQAARQRIVPDARLRALGLYDDAGARTAKLEFAVREATTQLPVRLPKADKIALLDELFELAMADGVWHREEAWLLTESARTLGLSGAEFDAWLQNKPGAVNLGRVLSYSAGSTQTGPDGYRKLGRGPDLRKLMLRWPDLGAALRGRTPMVINAYPAALGNFDYAVYLDTYLSPKTASRALQLAARDDMPVFLLGQPLLIGEMIFRHTDAGLALPDVLIVAVGGYPCPASLERAMREALGPAVTFVLLQGYGAAEVDAGMLFGRSRTAEGDVIWEPRGPDVIVERSAEGHLLLGLRSEDGAVAMQGFDTGDHVDPLPTGGYRIRNAGRRVHPETLAQLEGWSTADWRRRTGYVSRAGRAVQLRDGVEPSSDREQGFHTYAARFTGTWLAKPDWS